MFFRVRGPTEVVKARRLQSGGSREPLNIDGASKLLVAPGLQVAGLVRVDATLGGDPGDDVFVGREHRGQQS